MSHDKLTPKQERFCLLYIETGNASEAYRRAYNCGKMKEATINRNAFAMFTNSKIATRLKDVSEQHQIRHNITVDTLTERQIRVYDKHWEETPAAAVSAIKEVAKLHGLGETNVKHKHDHDHKQTHETLSKTAEWIERILGESADSEENPALEMEDSDHGKPPH